jgi:hypothetical protein
MLAYKAFNHPNPSFPRKRESMWIFVTIIIIRQLKSKWIPAFARMTNEKNNSQ